MRFSVIIGAMDFLSVAKPAREKLETLSKAELLQVRSLAKLKAKPYMKNGLIVFPWKVLILTASK